LRGRVTVPIQGVFNIEDVINYMHTRGIVNAAYDSDLDGIIDLSSLPNLAWALVGKVETTTAVSSISFTGLAGDTDKVYMLAVSVSNSSTTATSGIYIRYNDDTTVGNYSWITWLNGGTATVSKQAFGATTGVAGAVFAGVPATSAGVFRGIILTEGVALGTKTYVLQSSQGFNTGPRLDLFGGGWIKSAEVTSIELFTASGVAVNWKAYLYKAKW